MPGFPLFAVQPELLAKIINKFDETSYFRAQQTAREVNEFIRSCRSISVRVDGRYVLRTKKDQPSYRLYCLDRKIDIDLECFYGTRVKQLRPVEATEEFEPLYCSLKENRVTCTKLAMEAGLCQNRSWPGEDLKKLLPVLKPADVELNSETCNRFEVLLDSPRLKNVEVHLASDEQAVRATQFLSTFPSVTIHATRSTNHFSVVRSFLQILRTEQLPNLRVFRLRVEATRQLSLKEEQDMLLRDFNLNLNANSYFRLQQASRGVGQFIRTCRNICIHEEGRYVLCSKNGQSSYHLYHLGHRRYIDVECFYGTRINQLRPREATEEFEPLYCSLEENRITCMQLSMEAGICQDRSWPGEELKKLLQLLKPADIELNSKSCNRFEVLLDMTRLKSVELRLTSMEHAKAAIKLLFTCQSVKIYVTGCSEQFVLLRSVLQILRTEPLTSDECRKKAAVVFER